MITTGPAGETSGCHTYSPGLIFGVNGATGTPLVMFSAVINDAANTQHSVVAMVRKRRRCMVM